MARRNLLIVFASQAVTVQANVRFDYSTANSVETGAFEVWDGTQWVALWNSTTVDVNLPHHSYEFVVEPGLLAHLGNIVQHVAPHDHAALVVDARIALFPANLAWELALWGRNLADEEYFQEVFRAEILGTVDGVPGEPRTFGLALTYNF